MNKTLEELAGGPLPPPPPAPAMAPAPAPPVPASAAEPVFGVRLVNPPAPSRLEPLVLASTFAQPSQAAQAHRQRITESRALCNQLLTNITGTTARLRTLLTELALDGGPAEAKREDFDPAHVEKLLSALQTAAAVAAA